MAREVVEIRRVVGVMAGDLIRLKDYVTAQLDLRAPLAFLPFNQITQTHPGNPPPSSHAMQARGGERGCVHDGSMPPRWVSPQPTDQTHLLSRLSHGDAKRRGTGRPLV